MSAVPFIDLRPISRAMAPLVASDWAACADAADFIEGPRVAALEAILAKRLDVPHVVACANGTDALVLGLLSMGIGPGDTVALPALTFWATYEAVVTVGARPLLLDVDPDDLQMSLAALEAAHDRHRFKAAILVHLFGWTSGDLDALRSFCRIHEVALLEDGAQSFGVEVNGRSVYSDATVGTISFYPAKVIGAAGDAGAVTCQSAERASLLRSIRNHGRSAAYGHERVGLNSRMGALQGAYLLRLLPMADRILDYRRAVVAAYAKALDGRSGLHVHQPPPGALGNGYLAVVTSDRKSGDDLAKGLRERGIGHARTYPTTIADQPGAAGALVWGDLAVSRAFCQRVVNLPVFWGIEAAEVDAVIQALLEVA